MMIKVWCAPIANEQFLSILHQAGSQLRLLSKEKLDGALLDACLHTLCLVYVSLQAKNPLRRAIARSFSVGLKNVMFKEITM